MSKLLSANFVRLRKNKFFWAGIIFMLAVSVFLPIKHFIDMKLTGRVSDLELSFFSCGIFVAVILSVFCSLFVGTEYNDGTLRNKIAVGHKRTSIYLSNLITNMIVGLLMCFVFFAVYLCIGIPLLGFFKMDITVALWYMIVIILLSFAFSAIFTMIAMINSNKTIVAIICIVSAFLLILIGTFLSSRLQEPETYSGYAYSVDGMDYSDNAKNPNYLEGAERKTYQFFYDFLPGGQVIQCAFMESKNPSVLVIYSVIILIITTSIGTIIFKRKDIK